MRKDIEPKLKLISNYLKTGREIFVIPEYQRGYSWTILQCDKLWQDIEAYMESSEVNASGSKEPYFFGTIIADCSTEGRISLIDGQQRTTTFILLLKSLFTRLQSILQTFNNDEETASLIDGLRERRNTIVDILYKTDVDNRREVLEKWNVKDVTIIENRSINELDEFKNDLQVIVEAADFWEAERNCHKIPRKQKDNKYTNFFRNFKFFYEKLQAYSETQVNRFAKTFLNECHIIEIRSWNTDQAITMFNSLNSTGMPLSDADIISAQMYSHAGDDKSGFMEKWGFIKQRTDELNARWIINIDSVLQQYMYIRRAEDRVYVRNGSQPDVTVPGLRRYYTIEMKSLLKQPMELCSSFEKIVRIWDAIKDYPIVKLLLKFNDNTKIFLISYLNRYDADDVSEATVAPITECLLRLFTVLELVDAGYSSSRFKTFLFGENVKFVEKEVPVEEIVRDFTEHINRQWSREDIYNAVKEYDKNILVFLNEYLYAKSHSLSFGFEDTVNIEHIMPASGHNIDAIRQDADIATQEEFAGLVNLLGNKILLEEDINKSISNDWFKTKKQKSVNDKTGYKDSKYNIARALVNYPKDLWTKNDINEATLKVAERISSFIFAI